MTTNSQRIDLHVHSPASSDYLGDRSDQEYFALLRECKRAEVTAIAITDHNTVNGHIAFDRLKKESRLNYDLNSRRSSQSEFLDQLKEEMNLFEDIAIIRAVEISVYPKIHLILYFKETIDLKSINDFLENDLGLGDAVSKGSPERYCSLSPTALLDLATQQFNDNFFCILPHVDSSNGAWNELSGNPRAELFCAKQVLGVQVLSPETKRHFCENVFRSNEYKREHPLQIIQASDYHGGTAGEIARQYCVFETGARLSFDILHDYLIQGNIIKLSSDFIDENYKELVEHKHLIKFEFKNGLSVIDDELETILAKALCGCLNSQGAMLQFNILNSALSPGDEATKLSELIKNRLRLRLDPPIEFGYRLADLSHSPTRQRHIFEHSDNTRLRVVDGTVFTVLKQQVVAAGAQEIEQIVTTNAYNRFGKKRQKSLSAIANRLVMVANSFPALSTAYRIDQLIDRTLLTKLDHGFEIPEYSEAVRQGSLTKECNGFSEGDFVILRQDKSLVSGRLDGHYLRFTPPSYPKAGITPPEAETLVCASNTILIFPDGGVHFLDKEFRVYAPFPVYTVRLKEGDESIESKKLLGFCAFLKSSFCTWHAISIHETQDIFELVMRQFDRIPLPADDKLLGLLGAQAERIVVAERKLLNELTNGALDHDSRAQLIDNHNKACDLGMSVIDREIFRALHFSDEEVRDVYRTLQEMKIHDYGISSDLNQFIKNLSL